MTGLQTSTSTMPVSQASLDKLAKALELIDAGDVVVPSAEATAEAKELVTSAIVAETGAEAYDEELLSALAGRSKAHLCVALWMAEVHARARDLDALALALSKVAEGLLAELQKPEEEARSKEEQDWLTIAFTLVKARLVRCHCLRYESGGINEALGVAHDALETVGKFKTLRDTRDGVDALALLLLRYTEALQFMVSLRVIMGQEVDGNLYGYAAERMDNCARVISLSHFCLAANDDEGSGKKPAIPLSAVLDKTYPRPGLSFNAIHAEVYKNAGKAYRFLLGHVERTGEEIDEKALELETEVSVDGVAELFYSALSCAREEPDDRDCRTTAAVALHQLAELYAEAGRTEDARKTRAELAIMLEEGNLDESMVGCGADDEIREQALREHREAAASAA